MANNEVQSSSPPSGDCGVSPIPMGLGNRMENTLLMQVMYLSMVPWVGKC